MLTNPLAKMRAPSDEEQKEAPTAKKAKHEEQVRV